jgi:hypothetical protein
VLVGKPQYATQGRDREIGIRSPLKKEGERKGKKEKRRRSPEGSTLEPTWS